ncbi:reverse transcriptase [Gossypium australe]|uniref:Reverse transcriptase n=1 Tax=Gossypium australe TaxID=47621 RepID=A0A5B6V054_9ROSI|nr:reverse transcriptase [Gossypium australe]
MEDSLLAPTSTEDVPRTLRKFKRTRMVSYGQEDWVDACEEGMDWDVEDVDGDVCFDDVVSDSEEIVISGAREIFSVEEKREMRKPWRTALIVKLLGKILGIKALSSKVQQLWRLEGNYKIMDLDNDYFLFKFQQKSYYIHLWQFGGLFFCVGRVIRIDWNTEDVQRGGFARVCIDLDLTKPSCSSVRLGKVCQRVEYDGLQLICFQCGKFGHRKDSCPMSTTATSGTDKVLSSPTHVALDMPLEMPLQLTESFGPWMLVQRKTRKPVRDPVSNGKSSIGSDFRHDMGRFFALNVDDSVNSNHVPSPLNNVGKLASFVVLKDMATSSTGLVCNESSLVSSSANNATFGGCVGVFKGIWVLWKSSVGNFDSLPWLLIGDFNQILSLAEKQGGAPESFRRMDQFRDVMATKQLIQLDASGCIFTWSNGQYVHGLIRKKLDRALCNVAWLQTFKDVVVRNFPRSHSDHCPVVVSLCGSNWDNVELPDSLLSLQISLGEWNKSIFGNIFKRKRHLLARLDGVQKALEIRPNPFLFRLEKDLMTEYNIILVQEESLWTTVPLGDRQLAQLLHIPHDHEIHATLKSMAPWKSPSPDGFQVGFYQLFGVCYDFLYVLLIKWDFLRWVLMDLGLPSSLISLIMFYVTSTEMNVIWNGEKTKYFKPSQGLRQGQKVNYSKSFFFTSPNVPVEVVKGIASCSQIFHCTDLGCYLGVPLHSGHVTKHTYAYLLDKVKKPLASWKANQLSLVGRAVLVHHNFLWGSSPEKKKVPLVKWETVCQEKSKGGLSIRRSASMNIAVLAKLGWKLENGDSALWAQDCARLIGDGVATSFWYDKWLGNGSIMENFAIDVSPEFHHLNVKDVVVDPSSYKVLVDALPVEVRE